MVGNPWKDILRDLNVRLFGQTTDEFSDAFSDVCEHYKYVILENTSYNKIFDIILFIMRHPHCPPDFTRAINAVFEECLMAYVVDTNGPPTIFPAATPEEGTAIRAAREDLRTVGMSAADSHLQRAAELMNDSNWRESTHESISAFESVGISLGVGGNTLGAVLKRMRNDSAWPIHQVLLAALEKLYAYASDEQGVRHAAEDDREHVGREEAQFMLSACAASCSYLLGKQRKSANVSGGSDA